MLLPDFHQVIQIAMGWTNMHLHQFVKDKVFYTPEGEEDDDYYDDDIFFRFTRTVDYSHIKISDLLQREKDKMIYEYDFGDGWKHDIILEKILPMEDENFIPQCIKGKNNCPPEDIGGPWGYAYFLEVIQNPQHEEYEELTEWMMEDFDPKYFNKDEVNEILKVYFSKRRH